MSANTSPVFTCAPVVGIGTLSVANTKLDGTGMIVDLVTGSTNGTMITSVTVKATGVTTNGMVRLFISNGATYTLFMELAIVAATPSTTVLATSVNYAFTDLILPSGYKLSAATNNAEGFVVYAFGGNF